MLTKQKEGKKWKILIKLYLNCCKKKMAQALKDKNTLQKLQTFDSLTNKTIENTNIVVGDQIIENGRSIFGNITNIKVVWEMIKTDNVIVSRVYNSGTYIGTTIVSNIKIDEYNNLPLESAFNLDSSDMEKLDFILAVAVENYIYDKYKSKNKIV